MDALCTSGSSPTPAIDSADFRIENHGSIFLVVPLTDEAQTWVEENVSSEGYQPYWPTVVVEHRYIGNLVDGIRIDGLEVRGW